MQGRYASLQLMQVLSGCSGGPRFSEKNFATWTISRCSGTRMGSRKFSEVSRVG